MIRLTYLSVLSLLFVLTACQHATDHPKTDSPVLRSDMLWQSDLQNGWYQNPILHLDYSDPDVVAVDGVYYMTASSFNAAPGLPILRSTDLVNWTLINYALPKQVPEQVFSIPQHGNGVWAPNIRFHDGIFWIFYPDPDFGIYVVTAKDPAQKWSKPRLIKAGKGLIDPTPIWDVEGKAYLLHGWAKSRAGFNNVLSLREMADDASWVSDEYTHIVDGSVIDGYRTLEGPKFYQRNGYYYIFAPAGGVEQGWQSVFRATNIIGPYQHRTVMEQGDTLINGPHQGAWIQTDQGEDWFVHFQSRKAYGRIVHLQPMRWQDDWPVIGQDLDGDGIGNPVYVWTKPKSAQPGSPKPQPTSDAFDANQLGIQWQWNANPQRDWYALANGQLTLFAQPKVRETGDNLWMTPSLLLQKVPSQTYQVQMQVDINATTKDAEGGLLLFGEDYAWIGVQPREDGHHLVYVQCKNARKGCNESVHDYGVVRSQTLQLRFVMQDDATALFSYRTDEQQSFRVVGELFKARRGRWVGAKIGLFAVSEQAEQQLTVDHFNVLPMRRPLH